MTAGTFIAVHQHAIRLGAFLAVLALMGLWEAASPRRSPGAPKGLRWTNNLGIVVLNTALLRVLFPGATAAMAVFAAARGWGALNWLRPPPLAAAAIAIASLDLTIYLQHVMMHAVPMLWRLHRVHHADLDFDVTTGVRFHPLEIVLSMLIKLAAIALIGAPVAAVVIFETLLNAAALFNHGNVRLPARADRLLRLLVVTPEMHRVHHSIEEDETNSNFGFNLPWWDRLLGTYRAQPRAGQEGMTIGITTFRDPRTCLWLPGMLTMPFVGETREYALNRRPWRGRP